LHDGVPDWLVHPLLDWLKAQLRPWSVRQLALRMRIALDGGEEPTVLCDELEKRSTTSGGRWDLLDAIAYLVTMEFEDLAIPSEFVGMRPVRGTEPLAHLNYILERGGSAYRVGKRRLGLERRVDEQVGATIDRAAAVAGNPAGKHLRRAWDETYGLHPDPTTAYREALRAVEALACPLALLTSPRPTLGTVIAHLRQAADKWEVAIPSKDAAGALALRPSSPCWNCCGRVSSPGTQDHRPRGTNVRSKPRRRCRWPPHWCIGSRSVRSDELSGT
jgi:hypothetical protein